LTVDDGGRMALESLAQFGKRFGVSKQAVAKWKTKGYLVLDGAKIDVAPSIKRLRGFDIHPVDGVPQRRQPVDDQPKASTAAPPAAAAAKPNAADPGSMSDEEIAAFLTNLMSGMFSSKAEAERVKENALAGTRLLEFRRRSGELIEMSAARTAFFDAGRAFRDGLVQWARAAAPLMAAELGVDVARLDEVLSSNVKQHLDRVGHREPKFGSGKT